MPRNRQNEVIPKTALVTGASRGLGASIAKALGGAGYRVAVNYLHRQTEAGALAEAIGDAITIKADVSSSDEVRAMIDSIAGWAGRLDVIVNNASASGDELLVKTDGALWQRHMDVSLKGAMLVTREALPLLQASGMGHVMNIISRSGLAGRQGQSAYASAKAALVGLTLSLARELGPEGIRVNAIAPGYMPTEMGLNSPDALEAAKAASLLGRLSDPDEAASFVLWLAGTSGITGQVFSLDSRLLG